MARQTRRESIDPTKIQIIHIFNRCVRQAFLCGADKFTGKSFEHRRKWIRERFEFLSSLFAIDCLTFAILSNHFHVVLRSRPDVVNAWTDEEVARRWWGLSRQPENKGDSQPEPSREQIDIIVNDEKRLAEIRNRLSDISWWMKYANEKIAKLANAEDGTKGRFWEGRFVSVPLLDEASLLGCSMYVDLNIVRAAMAETPEESEFTGAKERIDDLKQNHSDPQSSHEKDRSFEQINSGWMSPLQIDERLDPIGPDLSLCGRRASLKGFLPISLETYLELLDWTGRQIQTEKPGSIPDHLAPILDRIGLKPGNWCTLVKQFDKLFKRAAGTPESIAREAARRGQNYMQAPGSVLFEPAVAA